MTRSAPAASAFMAERFYNTSYGPTEGYEEDERLAARFDRALTARAPELFGTPDQRSYGSTPSWASKQKAQSSLTSPS